MSEHPDPRRREGRIQHRPTCLQDQPPIEDVGTRGDRVFRCPECRAFWFPLPDDPTTLADLAGRQRPSAPAPSRFVCAEHHAPVSWRGTGCAACDAVERRPRRRRRVEVEDEW